MISLALAASLSIATSCGGNTATTNGDNSQDSTTTTQATAPQFNADSAFEFTAAQCAFGPRVPSTAQHAACANWLEEKLSTWAHNLIVQKAPVTTFDGKKLTALNFIAQFNPEVQERILLVAHWDCRPWADKDPDESLRKEPVMGANDAASGTAVLLELARIMHDTPCDKGVDLLLVDVEDWGNENDEDSWALGTQYWTRHPHVEGYKPLYGILLDMVGATGAQFAPEYYSMQYAPSVVQLVWDTAANAGFGNFFRQSGGSGVTDDHVAINHAGIPCIDIIDMRQDGFFSGWHTTHDTMDNIDRTTLNAVGTTLLHLLYP